MIKRCDIWKRLNWYGFTTEEAYNCPKRHPLWMYRIEQEEGQSMRQLLQDSADTARQTGYTLADLAREWGVPANTLNHWALKWGIHFPRGVKRCQE